MKQLRIFTLLLICLIFVSASSFPLGLEEEFKDRGKLVYNVACGGIPSGKVEWSYLGKQLIKNQSVDVLYIDSDTKILNLFDLTSTEKIFLNSQNRLPVKVERDLTLMGKKEVIVETYDQENGQVEIKNSARPKEINTLYANPPIYNIMALLYFFPKDIDLEVGKKISFNLPTQKVTIKIHSLRKISLYGKTKQVYLLEGRGAKRFNLYLDCEERIPLRIDFIFPLGRVKLFREEQP